MSGIAQLVHQSGGWFYLLTLVLTFLEGETFVLLAAAVSASGAVDPYKLGFCAWLGSCRGDQCWFFLGRWCGPVLLRRWPACRSRVAHVQNLFQRWDTAFILSFRFMYGIRNVSSIALGLSSVGTRRFLILNAVAAAIWAVIFVGLGVILGRSVDTVLGQCANWVQIVIAGAFIVALTTALLISRRRTRRLRETPLLVAGIR